MNVEKTTYSHIVPVGIGVRQSDILSTTLFCLSIDKLFLKLARFAVRCLIGQNDDDDEGGEINCNLISIITVQIDPDIYILLLAPYAKMNCFNNLLYGGYESYTNVQLIFQVTSNGRRGIAKLL